MSEERAELELVIEMDASVTISVVSEFIDEERLREFLGHEDIRSKLALAIREVLEHADGVLARNESSEIGWIDDDHPVYLRELLSATTHVTKFGVFPRDRLR